MKEYLASDYQVQLWTRQHLQRGSKHGTEGNGLRDVPNDTAVHFEQFLRPHARILEVGSANGRDARFWATRGHEVYALDFAVVALQQLQEAAKEQGVLNKVRPIVYNVAVGHLPLRGEQLLDGFYARSALHVDDPTMMQLAHHIDALMGPNGIICIEGKGPDDEKIRRSTVVEGNLAIDEVEHGHLRRVWTREWSEQMCRTFDWEVIELTDVQENIAHGGRADFLRLVARNK